MFLLKYYLLFFYNSQIWWDNWGRWGTPKRKCRK